MNKYKLKVFLCLSILLLTFPILGKVRADSLNSNNYYYEWKKDVLVSGNEEMTKIFYIPENMNIEDVTISLKVKKSPTLIKELSSLSILVNGSKVNSITMDKLPGNGLIDVKVSKDLIKEGNNSIAVKGFLKSTRDNCEINDEINWVIIEKGSNFELKYDRTDSKYIRNIFDSSYYSDGTSGEVNIVIPDKIEKENYSQVSSLSALLGYIHRNKEVSLDLKEHRYKDLVNLNKESIILGRADQVKKYNKSLLTDKEWERAEKDGYMAIRKIGRKNHFLLIASTNEEIETLVRTLQNKSSLIQIREKDYVLDRDKLITEKKFDSKFNLKDLGYESISQSGSGRKIFEYYFSIPGQSTLGRDNLLTFLYDYSSFVGGDTGYLTVSINDEYVKTKEILANKSQDKIELTIPEKYLEQIGFNIKLDFNLTPNLEDCFSRRYDNIWVSLDSGKSSLDLGLENRNKFSLLNSYGLFQNPNGQVDGSILVDDYKNISLNSIMEVSSYIGRNSHGVYKLLINEESGENENNAIFALTESPILEGIREDLIIPINNKGKFRQEELFIQNTDSLAYIEVMADKNQLLIVGRDLKAVNNAIKNYPTIVSDKASVIMRDNEIIGYFGEETNEAYEENKIFKIDYEIIIALGILLLGIIIILIVYYKRTGK